jgi:hypothetical protein
MALITLSMLATLTVVFATLARTEPLIAANHLKSAQTRAVADSGIAYVVWALTHAMEPGGFGGEGTAPNVVISATPTPPFDGSRFVSAGAGAGFFVTVTGSDQRVRVVRSVGSSPDPDATTRTRSQVIATVVRLRDLAREVTCALCVVPALALTGPMVVDARGSQTTDCGGKAGVATGGELVLGGGVSVFGANAAANEPAPGIEGRDWAARRATPTLTNDDLDTLKALAFAAGTYVRPTDTTPMAIVDVPDGLVFVDTPAGTNAITPTNRAVVAIRPGFSRRAPFRGWIVVNGDIALEGRIGELAGLVYAANTLSTLDTVGSRITGLVIVSAALDASPVALAGVDIAFDCAAARGSALLPAGWFVRPGEYCDHPSGC